jgi:flagellar basal body-associated protein FliL
MITEIKMKSKKSYWPLIIGGMVLFLFITLIASIFGNGKREISEKEKGPTTKETAEITAQGNQELPQMIKRYFETEPEWEDYAKQDSEILVAKYLKVQNLLKSNDEFTTAKILLTSPESDWTLKEIQHYLYLIKMIEKQ